MNNNNTKRTILIVDDERYNIKFMIIRRENPRVLDALTSNRPYKNAWPVNEAAQEIVKGKGAHFEPKLVEIFEKILPQLLEIQQRFKN